MDKLKLTKIQLSTLAVVGGPLAIGLVDDAQALDEIDFDTLCTNGTIYEDTLVADFSSSLTGNCDVSWNGPYSLYVENGSIDANNYGIYIDKNGSWEGDIEFNRVDVFNASTFHLSADGSWCDQYGNCYGNVTFKGGKQGNSIDYARLEAEDVDLDAYGDVLLKWTDTDDTTDDGNYSYDLDISSSRGSVNVQGNSIGDANGAGCVNELDIYAETSILIDDNALYLCSDDKHDWNVSASYGEINVKDNYIDMNLSGDTAISADVGTYGSINFSNNTFSADSSNDTVEATANYGSVIWKKNDFGSADVSTDGAGVSCQSLNNTGDNPC